MTKKTYLEYKKKIKEGKECEWCGSKYELTLDHPNGCHASRQHREKCTFRILCKTCHYFADFDKTLKCYDESKLRRYHYQMGCWFRRWEKV